jgi:hypothetical protein
MSNYPKKGTHPSKFLNVPGCAAINYPTDWEIRIGQLQQENRIVHRKKQL